MTEEEFSVYYLRDAKWVYSDVIGEICWCYTVRWSPPYTEDDNTLEPEDNLSCDELLSRFWDQFGGAHAKLTKRKLVLTSTNKWIEREKLLWRKDNPDAPPTPGPASSRRDLPESEDEGSQGLFSSPRIGLKMPPQGLLLTAAAKRKRSQEHEGPLESGSSRGNLPIENSKTKRPRLKEGSRDSTPLSQHSSRGSRKGKIKGKGKGKAKATDDSDSHSRDSTPLSLRPATADAWKGKAAVPVSMDQGNQVPSSNPPPFSKPARRLKLIHNPAPAPAPVPVSAPHVASPHPSTASSPDNMPLSSFPEITSPANAFHLEELFRSNSLPQPPLTEVQSKNCSTTDSLFGSSPISAPNTSGANASGPPPTSPTPVSAATLPTTDEVPSAIVTLPKKIDKHRGNKVKMLEAPNDLATPGNITKARRFNQQQEVQQWMLRPKQDLKRLSFSKKSLDSHSLAASASRSATSSTVQANSSMGTGGWGSVSKPSLSLDTTMASPVLGSGWGLSGLADSPLMDTAGRDIAIEAPSSPDMPLAMSATETPTGAFAEQTTIADPIEFLNTVADENPRLFGEATWSGDLKFIADHINMDIPVDFRAASDPANPLQPHFKVVLPSADEVTVRSTFSHTVFSNFLEPAYSVPFQFALVVGRSPGIQSNRLSGFAKHLRDTQQLAFSTLTSRKTPLSNAVIFFPAEAGTLCEKWSVPEDLAGLKDSLLAGLVKCNLDDPVNSAPPCNVKQRTKSKPPEPRPSDPILVVLREKLERPAYRRAMATLSTTPSAVIAFYREKYILFPDYNENEMDVYASALALLLKAVEARRVQSKDKEARLFFIHAKGLRGLEYLPKFNERRKTPELAFYTYGWNRHRSPLLGGLKNAFTLGGIITFTPRAILEDPLRVQGAIEKIQNEPFWEVYVHPFTIAMIHELLNQPSAVDESNSLNFEAISTLMLMLMWRGSKSLSIMTCPPTYQHERSKWVKWYLSVDQSTSNTPKRNLALCKDALLARFPRPKPKEQPPKPPAPNPANGSKMDVDRPSDVSSNEPAPAPTPVKSGVEASGSSKSVAQPGGEYGQATLGGWGEPIMAGGWGDLPADEGGGWSKPSESNAAPNSQSNTVNKSLEVAQVQAPPDTKEKVTPTNTPPDLVLWGEYATKDQIKKLEVTVETAILEDLKRMQLQPSLMGSYRRFVMFVDKESGLFSKLGAVEITRAKHFNFGLVSSTRQQTSIEPPRSATTTTNPNLSN